VFETKSVLLTLLGDSDMNKVIDYLIDNMETDVSIPDISQHTGVSRQTIYRLMEDLQDDEMVEITRKIGKINLFRINRNHERIKLMIMAEELINKELEK
jgi:DNA-binding transcriptional ArsR family regulator